jgi:hypothetical protein
MRLTTDSKFRLKALAMFGLEFYKVLMGTLLTIFVPHACSEADPHTPCSISSNLDQIVSDSNFSRRLAAGMNVATMVCVLVMYGFELYRENWIIEHLDIDPTKPNTNLDEEIEAYPEFKAHMHKLNVDYYKVASATFWLVIINFTASALYIFRFTPTSSTFGSSLLSLVSFLILVMFKLSTTRTNALASVKHERALSAYMTVHKTFNVIDPDYRKPDTTPPSTPIHTHAIELELRGD